MLKSVQSNKTVSSLLSKRREISPLRLLLDPPSKLIIKLLQLLLLFILILLKSSVVNSPLILGNHPEEVTIKKSSKSQTTLSEIVNTILELSSMMPIRMKLRSLLMLRLMLTLIDPSLMSLNKEITNWESDLKFWLTPLSLLLNSLKLEANPKTLKLFGSLKRKLRIE